MLELNRAAFHEKEEWYYRFSYVLISEAAELRAVMNQINETGPMKTIYA